MGQVFIFHVPFWTHSGLVFEKLLKIQYKIAQIILKPDLGVWYSIDVCNMCHLTIIRQIGYNEIKNMVMTNGRGQNTHGKGEQVKIPLLPDNVGIRVLTTLKPCEWLRHYSVLCT